jgi:hypothetical protein
MLATQLKKMYWQQQQGGFSPLPEGYTPVNYIEASGAQWIDTGVAMSSNLDISVDVQYTNTSSAQQMGCAESQSGTWQRFTLGCTRQQQGSSTFCWYFSLGTQNVILTEFPMDTERHTLSINGRTGVFTVDSQPFSVTTTVFSSSQHIYLCAVNMSTLGVLNQCKVKFFGGQIQQNGNLIRDFHPATRDSDLKPGLYDLQNDVFYTNSGSGADFTWA